ncbi:unknown protein [Simkania negevensis Z]|uniref:Uncharacterized protein n=1 Tax=Simkania negevensis (strain ATCC VR-1471 / DSM 27360 / Z) TaxID=331113 RepID=F8L4P5_SIMNZ|nr:unknown protein [Simkania negevensis Z]
MEGEFSLDSDLLDPDELELDESEIAESIFRFLEGIHS